jgi:hypothetical protein
VRSGQVATSRLLSRGFFFAMRGFYFLTPNNTPSRPATPAQTLLHCNHRTLMSPPRAAR